MSVFDVRGNGVGNVDKIVFADDEHSDGYLIQISKDSYGDDSVINFVDCYDECNISMRIKDVPNLILALQKAVELGWVPKAVVKKPAVKKAVVAKKPVAKKLPVKAI